MLQIPTQIDVLDFVYSLFFLAPGFVTYTIAITYSENDPVDSDFEKIAWSLIGSGVSLSLLYAMYVAVAATGTATEWGLLDGTLGMSQLALGYPVLLLIAVLLGFGTAAAYDLVVSSRTGQIKGNAWDFFRNEASKHSGIEVEVRREHGSPVDGYLVAMGGKKQDLIVAKPTDTDDHGKITEAKFTYLSEDEIIDIVTRKMIFEPAE